MRRGHQERQRTGESMRLKSRRSLWAALALCAVSGCSGGGASGSQDMSAAGSDLASGTGDMAGSGGGDMAGSGSGQGLVLVAGMLGGSGTLDAVGQAARFEYAYRIASDGAGKLYVGESTANSAIRQISLAGAAVTSVARGSQATGVAADGAGSVYFISNTTTLSEIRKLVLATGTVSVLAGGASGAADGTGTAAKFSAPQALALDGAGNLYVADTGSSTIRQVVIATGAVTTIAGTASMSGATDATGAAARFNQPRGLTFDGAGSLYIADTNNDTIRKLVLSTGAVTTLAGAAGSSGASDGMGAAARFSSADDVVSDRAGNLYVADLYLVRKIDAATGSVTTLAGTQGMSGSQDGTGSAARFVRALGVATDTSGSVYVADQLSIRKIVAATGAVTTYAGQSSHAGSVDAVGSAARFSLPTGPIAADDVGNIYVADQNNARIRKVALATGTTTSLAGSVNGTSDGTGSAASFTFVTGVAYDGAGSLFVSDGTRVRRIVAATGEVTTLAGGTSGSADGTGTAAHFSIVGGLASDRLGNLYVADKGNHTIRKIVAATGEVTTLAGTAGSQGSTDGAGTAARFTFPSDVAFDGQGSLYVTESSSAALRKIDLATATVAAVPGAALSGHVAVAVAADGAGSVYVSYLNSSGAQPSGLVRKIVLATSSISTVVGVQGQAGALTGALPGGLNVPRGLGWAPGQGLLICESNENAILLARGL